MKKHLSKLHLLVSFMMISLLFVINMPTNVHGSTEESVVRYIKNDYTNGAYLYEDNGVLRYGIPLKDAKEFQWEINVLENGVTIQNVATGNYITLKGQNKNGGNPLDPVQVLPLDETDDSFLWDIDINEPEEQNIISMSEDYTGYVLHLEGISNGQVAAEKLSGSQLSWGNVNWELYSENEINFDAITRDGFVIQNSQYGQYLLSDGNAVSYGIPTEPDNSFIWELEQQEDGTKLIKNKATNQYLTMSDYDLITKTLGLSDNPNNDHFKWLFQIAIQTEITSASHEYDGYHLIQGDQDDSYLKADNLYVNNLREEWNIIPAANVSDVVGDLHLDDKVYNFKNAWFSMYLIEDDGQATYGNVSPDNKNAQWRVVYDEVSGLTALINEGTGHYLQTGNGENNLSLTSEESYTLKLLRNKNDLYPDAVVFYDIVNETYIHMESLNGTIENSKAVQPNWGTPHWVPLAYDDSTSGSNQEIYTPSDDYIRIRSAYKPGMYLFQTAAGGIGYSDISEQDPRSHWKFVQSEEGIYILQNREYETYVTNLGNGVLRGFDPEQASGEGMLWQVTTLSNSDEYLIKNIYSDRANYHLPYLNVASLNGIVNSTLVSIEDDTTKWLFETAPESVEGVVDESVNNVLLNTFPDRNRYQIINNGKAFDGNYVLEYYGQYVRVKKEGTNDYLIEENGNIKARQFTNPLDSQFFFKMDNELGTTYLRSGEVNLELNVMNTESVYYKDKAYIYQDNVLFTVYAPSSNTYELALSVSEENTYNLSVNGLLEKTVTAKTQSEIFELKLNKGINTISVSNASLVEKLHVYDTQNKAYRGASVNYQMYEAEDAETSGTLLEEIRTYREIASEASERSAVLIDRTTQYVKFTLKEDMNALVLRYSIPDTIDGLGQDATLNIYINNEKTTAIDLSSKHSWLYGQYPWSNDPTNGNAHVFFDEACIIFDEVYPKGTEIMFRKDVSNYSSSYILDVIETELIEEATKQPENSISITQFGAKSNDDVDDTQSFKSALNAAISQGKELWIPVGTFDIDQHIEISDDNVVIRGAGMWYSELKGTSFSVRGNNISFYDFAMRGNVTTRRDNIDPAAIETVTGDNVQGLIAQNLWITHHKVGLWINNMDDIFIVGNRIRNTYADGINLHAGVVNAQVEQNDFRNTGDDAIGLWSELYNNENVNIYHNTIAIPWLANGIAVYGGKDINVSDNIVKDTIYAGSGINISTNFMPHEFEGAINVERNSLLRTGSDNAASTVGAIWFNTIIGYNNLASVNVNDNLILDSSYQGLSFEGGGIVSDVIMQHNVISNSGTYGIEILPNAKGSLIGKNNVNIRPILGESVNHSEESFTINLIKDNIIIESSWSSLKLGILGFIIVIGITGNVYLLQYFLKLKKEVK